MEEDGVKSATLQLQQQSTSSDRLKTRKTTGKHTFVAKTLEKVLPLEILYTSTRFYLFIAKVFNAGRKR